MRVTIGERLGLIVRKPKDPKAATPAITTEEPTASEGPSHLPRSEDIPSSSYVPPHPEPCEDDGGPPRVRGEMVWLHKTAPTLVIEGREGLSPEEHAAGRRR